MIAGRARVLDASALLALLFDEPGGEMVERGLTASVISAVNLSEVMQKSLERSVGVESLRDDLEALGVGVLAFDGDAAEEAANLRAGTRAAGLSLGDRACLALARQLDLPAVTADRTWEGLELANPVAVVVIR
ncbi:MAG TPA: type II toxin-antitoxin system VapC family toxin [Acidimicrobiales bacterium]|nr:type II toxin-antitoxin system VapC family toxin [Acidimicrobiales bacterium]